MATGTDDRARSTKARRRAAAAGAIPTTTTSPEPEAPVAEAAPKKSALHMLRKKRGRGRPRVSSTDTDRVTLRVEREHLETIDVLVRLKQYSNRSDAIRCAVKAFCEEALEDVEEMVAKQKQKRKLLELAALADQLDEMADR